MNPHLGKFEIIANGGHFLVLDYEDYILKLPKRTQYNKKDFLDAIVRRQNIVAKMGYAPRCARIDNYIFSEKAPGKQADQTNLSKAEFERRTKIMGMAIGGKKLDIREMHKGSNVFYCEETDKLTIVDFSVSHDIVG